MRHGGSLLRRGVAHWLVTRFLWHIHISGSNPASPTLKNKKNLREEGGGRNLHLWQKFNLFLLPVFDI